MRELTLAESEYLSEINIDHITDSGSDMLYELWKEGKQPSLLFLVPNVHNQEVMFHDGINQLGSIYFGPGDKIRKILSDPNEVLCVKIANGQDEFEDIFNNEHSLCLYGTYRVNERFARKYAAELAVMK